MDFSNIKGTELINVYVEILNEMKKQNLIRSKNVIGDLGEYIVIDYYNKTRGLPNLQFAPPSTKNIDAISKNGERYSIKCTSTNTSGTFWGIDKDGDILKTKQAFEYVVIIKLDENFQPILILEIDWNTFFKYKSWNSRMNAHNLHITNNLINDSKIIYKK